MNERVIHLEPSLHQTVGELLAWHVMGTLEPDDERLVQEHLAQCAGCRAELDWHRHMRQLHQVAPDARGAQAAFARLAARLPASAATDNRGWWARWRASALSLRAFAAVEAVLLVGVILVAVSPRMQASADYHALSAAPLPAHADLIVIFKPDARAAEVAQILQGAQLQVVGGPNATGAYLVSVQSLHSQAGQVSAPGATQGDTRSAKENATEAAQLARRLTALPQVELAQALTSVDEP